MQEEGRTTTRRSKTGRGPTLSVNSPLLGGPLQESGQDTPLIEPVQKAYEPRPDVYEMPRRSVTSEQPQDLDGLLPLPDPNREVDDWGRSEHFYKMIEPILDFYYNYWFRVDVEGIDYVPAEGGALLAANHAGALPPDALMIAQAIRHEHPKPRSLYMLGEHWFKNYPIAGMIANKIGMVPGHPANAQRLLSDEERLVAVFPEGQKGTRKVYWQRYRLRRFGRGGFITTAMKARVPIVPVAVIGAEEAMPIFAHIPLLQKLTGLIYFPISHAFPHFGPAGAAMYLPAKFKIRFLDPVDLTQYGPEAVSDVALVQSLSEDVRGRIQTTLEEMLGQRRSIWLG